MLLDIVRKIAQQAKAGIGKRQITNVPCQLEPLEGRLLLSLVGLTLDYPLISFDSNGVIQYAAATDAFDATATPLSMRLSSSTPPKTIMATRALELHFAVNDSGQFAGGIADNDFTLTGNVDINGDSVIDYGGVLLTGEVVQFGWSNTSPVPGQTDNYEVRLIPTGGSLMPFFAGKDIGIVITSEHSSFDGGFNVDFAGGAKGTIGPIAPLLSSLSGYVYEDANDNGVFDVGELPIQNATVALTGTNIDNQAVNVSAMTDANGAYSFAGLRPGDYTISETQPAGYLDGKDTQGTPGNGTVLDDIFQGILLGAGVNGTDNNFGEIQIVKEKPASISGVKYRDMTGNGLTCDDVPLGGMTINLFADINSNGVLDAGDGGAILTTVTDNVSGSYEFSGLAPSVRYFVREQVSGDYVRTAPTLSDGYMIYAVSGMDSTGNDFANFIKGDCRSYLTDIYYVINGTRQVTNLRGNTNQGDQIEVMFTVIDGGSATVSLVTYTAPEGTFIASHAAQQQIFELQTGTFGPGTYAMTVQAPNSYYQVDFICGSAIDHLGPAGSNIFYSAQGRLISADNDGTQAQYCNPASLAGSVYIDANNDGIRQADEVGIFDTIVTLTGVDNKGHAVTLIRTTDDDGQYSFRDLRPGTYAISETQPNDYMDGLDAAGSLGGTVSADRIVNIVVQAGAIGVANNFGELVPTSDLGCGMTATIGFWNNKNGQKLIMSLNSGRCSTALGKWLAVTFPKMYGNQAGSMNLACKTNTQIAALFQTLFKVRGQKLDAQVMATALATYVTDSDLAGTTAARYGFTISPAGTGAMFYNIGCNGSAFGVSNGTIMSVMDVLTAANNKAHNGVLYAGNVTLRNQANCVFDGINQTGDIC